MYERGGSMRSHIQKWGNSLGVRIPMQLAKQLQLHVGSAVALEVKNGHIVIRIPRYDLETMVNAITPTNQHHQLLDDKQVGSEVW